MKSIIFILSFLSFTALAQNSDVPDKTDFYYGESSFTAADGTRFGSIPLLIKRTVSQKNKKIEERSIQGAAPKGEKIKEVLTTFTQDEKNPNLFKVSDSEKILSGTVEFQGKAWEWTSWKYNLSSEENGSIKGEGSLNEKGIKALKTVHDGKGIAIMSTTEQVEKVTEDKYKQEKTKLGVK